MVFIGWGAEEYAFMGSLEWTEQFGKQLVDRTVAYLNMDMAIEGRNVVLEHSCSNLQCCVCRTTLMP